jgi:hypothetical protein
MGSLAQRRIEGKSSDGDALARLIGELGRAAQAGWGPTGRWLAFLVVIAGALAILAMIDH